MSTTSDPRPFHVMVKPAGADCNLECQYCYFLSKESMYAENHSRMSDEALERFTRQYVESSPYPEITFSWQGGEPTLMGLDFFKRAIALQQKYVKRGVRVFNALQTNGTLLNESWCRFFKKYGFLIGLSLDGPKEVHDRYRVNKAGKGSFDNVLRGWRLLDRVGVQYNVLCSVHKANQDHGLAVYRFFRDQLTCKHIQFIPIVERATEDTLQLANQGWKASKNQHRPLYTQTGNLVTDRSVEPEKYGLFLTEVFDEWVRNDVGEVYVQIFDVALGAWVGQPGGLCVFSPTCGNALALEHNGDLFSCDHFVEPDYRLGNISDGHMRDLASSEQQIRFGQSKNTSLPTYCKKCDVAFACFGECPKNRFIPTPDGEPGLNFLCQSYKTFFSHIDGPMKTMGNLLRQKKAPAEIMKTSLSN